MPILQNSRPAALLERSRGAASRWRHPFDSATGTVTLGVLLTIVLVVALRLWNS